jgi:type VI secretion system protein ImpJ
MDEGYVPPVCHIGASDALMAMLQRTVDCVGARIRVLDERRERLGAVAEFGAGELAQFLLLQLLRPAYAVLTHHLRTPATHPESVYLELARLISGLRAFHPEVADAEPPAYAHDSLGSVFLACEAGIRSLLSDVVPRPMTGIDLRRESSSLCVASAVDGDRLRRSTFFLAVRFVADSPDWVGELGRQIKVGAREDIELILGSALPGVPVVHVQRPPNRLPVKSGYEYFRLEAGGEFWDRVLEHHSIAVFLPRAFAAAEVEIVTVDE